MFWELLTKPEFIQPFYLYFTIDLQFIFLWYFLVLRFKKWLETDQSKEVICSVCSNGSGKITVDHSHNEMCVRPFSKT